VFFLYELNKSGEFYRFRARSRVPP
jgi:hypothetical protein